MIATDSGNYNLEKSRTAVRDSVNLLSLTSVR